MSTYSLISDQSYDTINGFLIIPYGLSMKLGVNMKGSIFDSVVSLGGKCQTAFQINRYFYDGQKGSNYFNWLETPTLGLIELLESEFSNHHELENLNLSWGGKALTCSLYGLGHIHDYDSIKIDGNPEGLIDLGQLENYYPIVKEKFDYFVRKFKSLQGNILFIRAGSGSHAGYDKNCELDDQLITRLYNALRKNLPSDTKFKVLLIDLGNRESFYNPGNFIPEYLKMEVFSDHVQWYAESHEHWQGSDKGWNEMLHRWNFRLK